VHCGSCTICTSPASGSLSDDTYRFFADIRRISEQLTAVKRWYRIVGHAPIKYLRGQQLRPLQHAQPCPVRLKTAFGARVPTHGFSFIGARLSRTVVLWPSNRYRCSGTYGWPNDIEARGGLLYALAVVAYQAGRKSCAGSASRPQINREGTAVLNAQRARLVREPGSTRRDQLPGAHMARGGLATAPLWLLHFQTPHLLHSAYLPSHLVNRAIHRTAVYRPVRAAGAAS
jgi:hypothetical protein